MRKCVKAVMVMMLGGLVALGMGCEGGGGGSGGGGGDVQVRPVQDGEFVGFLWKPNSESNGRLVVLLPHEFENRVGPTSLHRSKSASNDTLIEYGGFAGNGNGDRPHFRFSRSGGTYGSGVWVIADTEDGIMGWEIPNGAARWD